MKKILLLASLALTFTMCKPSRDKTNNAKKIITEKTIPIVETVFSSQTIRSGNLALTSNGRLFVSITPLINPETKVFELNTKNDQNHGYPNAKYATGKSSILKAVVGIRTDSKDQLWLLDMGTQQFTVWDTKSEELVKTIKIPSNVVVPTSFLQDFVIDEKHNRVIIADMTQGDLKSEPIPAFIVINTKTGEAKRMLKKHPTMMPEIKGGFALNPIAIDSDFKWVYYGALHGKKVFRVPASSFDSNEKLANTIEEFAPKSFCDGIAVDANENVYVTNIEESSIGVTNKTDGFKTLATLPEGQSWPDGLYIANDGYVYGTVDQLNRTAALNNGKNTSTGPYLVVRTKLVQ